MQNIGLKDESKSSIYSTPEGFICSKAKKKKFLASNIVITHDKQVQINVFPLLAPAFSCFLEINTFLLNSRQAEVYKRQFIFARLNTLINQKGYSSL